MAPDGWRQVHLAEVADQRTEKIVPARADRRPYVALEHLAQGRAALLGWSNAGSAVSAKTFFRTGDVLFGKLRPHLRKAAPAPFDGLCSTDILPLFCKHTLDRRYLAQLAQWLPLQQHAVATSSGTKMPRTSWKQLGEFQFLLPPPTEQCRIATILSSVDDAIEKTQAVINQVQVVKCGLMQELLSRGLPGRHTRFKQTEIGSIPEDWSVVAIGELGHDSRTTVRTGPFGSSMKTKDFRPSGVPVLTIQSLGEGELNASGVFFVSQEKADELSEYSVTEGDLVFSRVADIGRSLAVDERLSGWLISPNLMRIRLDHRKADARFMMYSMTLAKAVQRQIANLSGNAGRPVVSSSILRRIRVPVPPPGEQCEIVRAGREIEHRIKTEAEKLALLGELKFALMSVLLTGELRVTVDTESL